MIRISQNSGNFLQSGNTAQNNKLMPKEINQLMHFVAIFAGYGDDLIGQGGIGLCEERQHIHTHAKQSKSHSFICLK